MWLCLYWQVNYTWQFVCAALHGLRQMRSNCRRMDLAFL